MNDLAVVTLTNNLRTEWLAECIGSVKRNLPLGAVHYVIPCASKADYSRCRLEALQLAKYVVFVDDDDLVINDSLSRCLAAAQLNQAAVAFTDEVCIDHSGNTLDSRPIRSKLLYSSVATSVKTIHHLAVIQTSFVPAEVTKLVNESNCHSCVDWLIVGSAALTGGAVHLPIRGYQWRHHDGNMHKADNKAFTDSSVTARKYLSTLINGSRYIPSLGGESE